MSSHLGLRVNEDTTWMIRSRVQVCYPGHPSLCSKSIYDPWPLSSQWGRHVGQREKGLGVGTGVGNDWLSSTHNPGLFTGKTRLATRRVQLHANSLGLDSRACNRLSLSETPLWGFMTRWTTGRGIPGVSCKSGLAPGCCGIWRRKND
jgi:hypothetical protein